MFICITCKIRSSSSNSQTKLNSLVELKLQPQETPLGLFLLTSRYFVTSLGQVQVCTCLTLLMFYYAPLSHYFWSSTEPVRFYDFSRSFCDFCKGFTVFEYLAEF